MIIRSWFIKVILLALPMQIFFPYLIFASDKVEQNNVSNITVIEDEWINMHEQSMKLLFNKIRILELEVKNLQQKINLLGQTSSISKAETSAIDSNENIQDDKMAYDLALADLKDQKFEEAEKKFSGFIIKYPNSKLQGNAYFWYGESFFRRGLFDKAAVNYLKGYTKFPKEVKAADSLLKLAISLGEINQKSEACKILNKLEIEFPRRAAVSVKRSKDAAIKFGCNIMNKE